MSMTRAAIRRERKEREKIEKKKGKVGDLARAAEQGKLDGRAVAFCTVANLLYDLHGFRKVKIKNFLEKCNHEAARSENRGVMFALEYYAKKLVDKISREDIPMVKPKSIIDSIYQQKRDEYFISAMSIMIDILVQDYSFGSNSKNTGRLDTILEFVAMEYIKIQCDATRTVKWYMDKTSEKTGIEFI